MYPYFLLLCGHIPHNIRLLPNYYCSVNYKGHEIISHSDGILAFIEVLQDRTYERIYQLRPGDVVVDIGAYVGMFSVAASLEVGATGKIVAIEPAESNLTYLVLNTENLGNVIVVAAAAGETCGTGELTISNASPCHSLIPVKGEETATVRINTLDNIISDLGITRVDFIKIDAEGSELSILKGAVSTLGSNDVKLAIAAYHDLPSGEREMPYICQLLETAGFKLTIIDRYVYACKQEVDNQ
jgi:FkbM family methyltransferase